MCAQRIKGQECNLLLVQDGQPLDTITDVRSFEITAKLDVLEEGYLGETTVRLDEIFKGCKGKITLHFENKDVFDLITSITARARRRTPGLKINAKVTLNFPNGDRPRVQIKNLFFGDIPMNFAGRSDYGEVTLDFQVEDQYTVIS